MLVRVKLTTAAPISTSLIPGTQLYFELGKLMKFLHEERDWRGVISS